MKIKFNSIAYLYNSLTVQYSTVCDFGINPSSKLKWVLNGTETLIGSTVAKPTTPTIQCNSLNWIITN